MRLLPPCSIIHSALQKNVCIQTLSLRLVFARQSNAIKSGESAAKKLEFFKPALAKRAEAALALAGAVLEGMPPPTVTSFSDRVLMGAPARVVTYSPLCG